MEHKDNERINEKRKTQCANKIKMPNTFINECQLATVAGAKVRFSERKSKIF